MAIVKLSDMHIDQFKSSKVNLRRMSWDLPYFSKSVDLHWCSIQQLAN